MGNGVGWIDATPGRPWPVKLGIHFYGTYAQGWWVDNVVVDSAGGPFSIDSAYFPAGGWGWVNISGAKPNGPVILGITGSTGSTLTRFGMFGISLPIAPWYRVADYNGNLKVTHHVNVSYTGGRAYCQAVDVTTGALSNVHSRGITGNGPQALSSYSREIPAKTWQNTYEKTRSAIVNSPFGAEAGSRSRA